MMTSEHAGKYPYNSQKRLRDSSSCCCFSTLSFFSVGLILFIFQIHLAFHGHGSVNDSVSTAPTSCLVRTICH